MPGIFISYRRNDSIAWAGRLFDSLKNHFPGIPIFMDIEAIPPGTKFSQYIRDAVGSCDVLFVLIGPNWLTATDKEGVRRLDDSEDFVALEIRAALERDVRVIPTLVGETSMPIKQALPDSLKTLCDFQNFVISDRSWHDDCARLAKHIQGVFGEQLTVRVSGKRRKVVIVGISVVALISVALFFWYNIPVKPPTFQKEAPVVASPPLQREAPAVTSPPLQRETPAVTSPPPAEPSVNKPTEHKVPVPSSLLDVGLEGRWELVEIGGEHPNQRFLIELARAGDALKILTPSKKGTEFVLYINPNQMKLVEYASSVILYANRDSSEQQDRWIVSAVEKNKNSKSEKSVGQGWIKISEDWHRFKGELIDDQTKNLFAFGMTIDKGEKKCEVTWRSADMPSDGFARFNKL